jgi:hypothetical protein
MGSTVRKKTEEWNFHTFLGCHGELQLIRRGSVGLYGVVWDMCVHECVCISNCIFLCMSVSLQI